MRSLTTDFKNALDDDVIRLGYLAEMQFGSTTINLWTGIGDLVWDSKTWQGTGILLDPDGIHETSDVEATEITIQLSGVEPTLRSLIFNDAKQTDTCTLYLASFNSDGSVIVDPALIFQGFLDVPEIVDGDSGTTISISYSSALSNLSKTKELRYNAESQKILYPSTIDRGFDFMIALENWSGIWGKFKNKRGKKDKKRNTKRKNRR